MFRIKNLKLKQSMFVGSFLVMVSCTPNEPNEEEMPVPEEQNSTGVSQQYNQDNHSEEMEGMNDSFRMEVEETMMQIDTDITQAQEMIDERGAEASEMLQNQLDEFIERRNALQMQFQELLKLSGEEYQNAKENFQSNVDQYQNDFEQWYEENLQGDY